MKFFSRWLVLLFISAIAASAHDIFINELMYHPASEDVRDEYVELFNSGTNAVSVMGWRFTAGVRFVFPDVSIPAGGFLVVAADAERFRTNYPGVTNVVGNWEGVLSNSGQNVDLRDALGQLVDTVNYADEGDWGTRELGPPDAGHRGLVWNSAHDGRGASLELISSILSNDYGQAWGGSTATNGTPGRVNSIAAANVAPLILDVAHYPIVPKSTDPVIITTRIVDEWTNLVVTVHHRIDGAAQFAAVPMNDAGEGPDPMPFDGIYTTILPPQTNSAIVEFYIEARDASGLVRTYPAPTIVDAVPEQTANLLYQVDDTPVGGGMQQYRMVARAVDYARLRQINRSSPSAPFPTSDQTRSHAQVNATFISADGSGLKMRYNVGVRNRGNGSRSASPQSFRVNFRSDQTWNGVASINLNSQNTYLQLIGSAVFQNAGMLAADSRPVRVRVNNIDLALSAAPMYGFYVSNEVIDSEFADHHVPDDSSGNIYRAIRLVRPGADLGYLGEEAEPYRPNYFKRSNVSEDDWTDLIELTRVLTNAPDANFVSEIEKVLNLDQWLRHVAMNTLLVNNETSISNGDGDDYFLFRGDIDRRFQLIPYDLDTIFGLGSPAASSTASLFRATERNSQTGNTVPIMAKILLHPDITPRYFKTLKDMIETDFAPPMLNPLVDHVLGRFLPLSATEPIKRFAVDRGAYVLSQMPLSLTVSNDLSIVDGFRHTTAPEVTLYGTANVIETRSVFVAGQQAVWSPANGKWAITNLVMVPGINRIVVEARNASGAVFESGAMDIWYESAAVQTVAGLVSQDTNWKTSDGSVLVSADLTVAAGVTLTISPGTTVRINPGVAIIVNGRLLAEGSRTNRIRFTRAPRVTGNWGGLVFNNSGASNRIAHADFDFGGSRGQVIRASGSVLFLDDVTISNCAGEYLTLTDTSIDVRNSRFADTTGRQMIDAHGLPADGFAIIENNWFGTTTGLNDIIDFTGGQRPGAILQILNNTFTGGSDDILDLDGTDAHIEGNIFMHVHQSASLVDTASAISGGEDGVDTSEVTIVRNLFYDCDHIAMAKEGNFYTLVNNTAVHLSLSGMQFDEPGRRSEGVFPGRGAYFDGNIIWGAPANFEDVYVNHAQFGTTDLTIHRSIFPAADFLANGVGNLRSDPRLFNSISNTITAANIRETLRLRPGSPALGAGPNGLDMGADVPAGASISGEPPPITWRTTARLVVGGPGITHYKFRVNEGAWSDERPVSTAVDLNGLANGEYTVHAIGKNSAGVWQTDTTAARSKSWTVDASYRRLLISEVLARNDSAVVVDGRTPDLIELLNDSPVAVDLTGMGLTDDPTRPYRFTFPDGASIPSGGYLVVYADDQQGAGYHLGFGLNDSGDGVYLFSGPDRGGEPLDSVTFGFQIADASIARMPEGAWTLAKPTFGTSNVSQRTGDASLLKINEWLADSRVLFHDDFIELHNPDLLPVNLGGLYLTDEAVGAPLRHRIPPLTFIAARGQVSFLADGDASKGAEHLSFKLAAEQGTIGLFDADGQKIDVVIYGTQAADISEGRTPNGAPEFSYFPQPTPAGGNPGSIVRPEITITTTNLITMTNEWRYHRAGVDLATAWREMAYSDAAWSNGLALFHKEENPLPAPKNTPISFTSPQQITFYFRTHLNFTGPTNGLTLHISHIIDDGAVFYLNGAELARYNMDPGPVYYTNRADNTIGTAAFRGPIVVTPTNLVQGDNLIAVEVHQVSSTSSDIVFGAAIDAVLTVTNTFTDPVPVRLNEVLSRNATLTNASGVTADWIELFNPSDRVIDLSDLSLTDAVSAPRKWVFPSGATIAPKGYLVIECDDARPASPTNTGFSLKGTGDDLFLFDRLETGGGLLDSVTFGFQVTDFSLGRSPDGYGPWRLMAPTPDGESLPVTLGDPSALRINEWMASPSSGDDWFELVNLANQPVELSGFFLTDNLAVPHKSEIPPLSFIGPAPHGFVKFIADEATTSGADHVDFKLSANGEPIGLFAQDDTLIDTVRFGGQTFGVAEGKLPDGSAATVRFPGTATPGEGNYLPLPNIVINEVLAHTDAPLEDAVELLNLTSQAVPIGGWFLSNDRDWLGKYRIPDGAVVPANGYLVLYETQFNADPGAASSFGLNSARGDDLILSAIDASGNFTGYRAQVKFGASANGVSFGRVVTSTGPDFSALSRRTFGADSPNTVEEFRRGTGLANAQPRVGPIVISEIHFQPSSTTETNVVENPDDEFIELQNLAGQPVSLFDEVYPTNSWRLRDAVSFTFSSGAKIPARGFAIVVGFDPAAYPGKLSAFRTKFRVPAGVQVFGPFTGRLDNSSDSVELVKPDAPQRPPQPDAGFVPSVLVERVAYSVYLPWPGAAGDGKSLQRIDALGYGNEALNWKAELPSAGRSNVPPPADRDGDGMPDDWELANHFNPDIASDAQADTDGDGMSNLEEFQAGTDPRNSVSALRIESISVVGTSVTLRFNAVPNVIYEVHSAGSLSPSSWLLVRSIDAQSTARTETVTDAFAGDARRFYRVTAVPRP